MKEDKQDKHISKKCMIIVFSLLALVFFGAVCVTDYIITLNNTKGSITVGVNQTVSINGVIKDLTVYSQNEDVAVTDKNNVTGVSLGQTTVCVEHSFFNKDFYNINVISAPSSLTLDKTELHLGTNETYTLKYTCKSGSYNFTPLFGSSDTQIATVDSNGVVSAVSKGKCEITASSYNGLKAVCKITVSDAVTNFSLSRKNVTLGTTESIELSEKFKKSEFSNSVTYSSSDNNIASVSGKTIIANNTGTCTIKAKTFNGVTAECNVVVKKLPDSINIITLDKYRVGSKFKVITDTPPDCYANDISVSVSDNSVLEIDKKNPVLIKCKKSGKCDITVTLKNGVKSSKTITVANEKSHKISGFKILNQFPTLPTGCEVVSLTSVLNHYGCKVSMTTMADKYMPKKSGSHLKIDPDKHFIGSPRSRNGFGCYAGCIVQTAKNYFDKSKTNDYIAVDITGCTANELYDYIENDIPVITWVTSGFVTPSLNATWTVNGKKVRWCNHEHCLVTTGYNKDAGTVTVADDSGGYSYNVPISKFESVFKGMGSKAVVIMKK